MQIDPSSSSPSSSSSSLSHSYYLSLADDVNDENSELLRVLPKTHYHRLGLSSPSKRLLSNKELFVHGGGCVLNSFPEAIHDAEEEALKPGLLDVSTKLVSQKQQKETTASSSLSNILMKEGPSEDYDVVVDDDHDDNDSICLEMQRLPLAVQNLRDKICEFEKRLLHLREEGGGYDDELAVVLSLFDDDEEEEEEDSNNYSFEMRWLLPVEQSLRDDIAEFEERLLHLLEEGGEDDDELTASLSLSDDEDEGEEEEEEEEEDNGSMSLEMEWLPSVEQSLCDEIMEFEKSLLKLQEEEDEEEGAGGDDDERQQDEQEYSSPSLIALPLAGDKSQREMMLDCGREDQREKENNKDSAEDLILDDDLHLNAAAVLAYDDESTACTCSCRSINKSEQKKQQQSPLMPMLQQLPSAMINKNIITDVHATVRSMPCYLGNAVFLMRRGVSHCWRDFCGHNRTRTTTISSNVVSIIGFCTTIGAIGLLGFPPEVHINTNMVGSSIYATGILISLVW